MTTFRIEHAYTGEVLALVCAAGDLEALDRYAVAEGFSPYSELDVEEPNGEWTYMVDGVLHGVFTNYEIRAVPADTRQAYVLLSFGDDYEDPSAFGPFDRIEAEAMRNASIHHGAAPGSLAIVELHGPTTATTFKVVDGACV
jgi:hypothetical protein